VDIYPKKPTGREVTLRLARLGVLLGIEVPTENVLEILAALKFQPRLEGETVVCSAPSWRSDVYREADLIEEVARVYGYGKVPTERKIEIEVLPAGAREKLSQSIGAYLNGCGYYETINVTFVDQSVADLFAGPDAKGHMAVRDVSRKRTNLLRQTLIGSLLGVLKTNVNAKNLPCRIFEIADTFVPTGRAGTLPVEEAKLALVCDGGLRELTGVVEGLIKGLDRNAQTVFSPAEVVWAQTGAEILVDGKVIGTAGVVSKAVRDAFDFKEVTPCAAELDFASLLELHGEPVTVRPIPRFPGIQRDLSIIVDEAARWSSISEAVQARAPGELEDIRFVDIYRGKGIPSGKKSVTLSLRFRDEDGTLTHEAVDKFEAEIVRSLAESVGAELRTV